MRVIPGGISFHLCGRDNAGNVGTWTGHYRIDNQNPEASLSYPSGEQTTDNLELAISIGDHESGIASCQLQVSNSQNNSNFDIWEDLSYNCLNNFTTTLEPGKYYRYRLIATDNVGNSVTVSPDYSSSFNPENLTAVITGGNSGSWANNPPSSSITVISENSSVQFIRGFYRWNTDFENSTCDQNSGGEAISSQYDLSTIPTSGATLYLCLVDNYGRITSYTDSFYWEETPPVVAATGSSDSWLNSQPSVNLTASDAGGSGLIEIRGALVAQGETSPLDVLCTSGGQVYHNNNSLNVPAGIHTLYLCARDGAGNVATWSGNYLWENIDPTITSANASVTDWYYPDQFAQVEISDASPSSGLATITYLWGSSDFGTNCANGTILNTGSNQLALIPGQKLLHLCAIDSAGNQEITIFPFNTYYTLTTTTNDQLMGTVDILGDSYHQEGATISAQVTTNSGHSLQSLTVNGVSIDLQQAPQTRTLLRNVSDPNWDSTTQTYTFSSITQDHQLDAVFAATPTPTPSTNTSSSAGGGSDSTNHNSSGCAAANPGNPAPSLTAVTPVSDTQVLLQFSPGAGPRTGFQVAYGPSHDQLIYGTFIDDDNATAWRINDLQPSTEYYFQIFAVNDCAAGPRSGSISTTTLSSSLTSSSDSSTTNSMETSTNLDLLAEEMINLGEEDKSSEAGQSSSAQNLQTPVPAAINQSASDTASTSKSNTSLDWLIWLLVGLAGLFFLLFFLRPYRISGQLARNSRLYLYQLDPENKQNYRLYRQAYPDENGKYKFKAKKGHFYLTTSELTPEQIISSSQIIELSFAHRHHKNPL